MDPQRRCSRKRWVISAPINYDAPRCNNSSTSCQRSFPPRSTSIARQGAEPAHLLFPLAGEERFFGFLRIRPRYTRIGEHARPEASLSTSSRKKLTFSERTMQRFYYRRGVCHVWGCHREASKKKLWTKLPFTSIYSDN